MDRLRAAMRTSHQRFQPGDTAPADWTGAHDASERSYPVGARGSWEEIQRLRISQDLARERRLFLDGQSSEAIHFDKLRTKVIQRCRDNGWRRILVTSATMGCGKTTTCANLAASFARQTDWKLVVADMDMRRPALGRVLGVTQSHGFSDVLDGAVTFEKQAVRLGSSVIAAPNRRAHSNPAQLILQTRTSEILDTIDRRYNPDIMMFDTPPLLSTDDALGLVRQVDCALIVAGAETSTVAEIDECERELAEFTNVLGVVLNRCRHIDPAQMYT